MPTTAVTQSRELPTAIRSAAGLDRYDYFDVFTATTGGLHRSAEDWARAIIERTRIGRRPAPVLWTALGLRLERRSPAHVGGWAVVHRGERTITVETASWYMTARAVVLVEDATVTLSLFVRYDNPVARVVWPPISVLHQRGVPTMLRQAMRV